MNYWGIDMIYSCACKRQCIANLDHVKLNMDGRSATPTPMVNKVCVTCRQHWYGEVGSVKEYTGKEWDALILETFEVTPE